MKWLVGSKVFFNGMKDPSFFSEGDVSLLRMKRPYTVRNIEVRSEYTLLFIDELNGWYNSTLFDPQSEKNFSGLVDSAPQLGAVIKCLVKKFNSIVLDNPAYKKSANVISVGILGNGEYCVIDSTGDQYVVSIA